MSGESNCSIKWGIIICITALHRKALLKFFVKNCRGVGHSSKFVQVITRLKSLYGTTTTKTSVFDRLENIKILV